MGAGKISNEQFCAKISIPNERVTFQTDAYLTAFRYVAFDHRYWPFELFKQNATDARDIHMEAFEHHREIE